MFSFENVKKNPTFFEILKIFRYLNFEKVFLCLLEG